MGARQYPVPVSIAIVWDSSLCPRIRFGAIIIIINVT